MKILSSFTHLHVAPNLFDFLSSIEHRIFNRIFKVLFHTIKVNGDEDLNLQKDNKKSTIKVL